ncbi:hypothetical protein P22_0854 [Propionispora sp. 2/2-37]|uniref:aldose epimerase family protein n=1 Tax=Propionispora sp. 2/2-37 TaxID=1677858 RepID=UPI0006BB692D|nr:DUF5107 domain-containing protein [Propionispora sp. 2/2-37]CUH94788.1 hypothetical protein P22_0854 [Propionispora sp. 2/2-37]
MIEKIRFKHMNALQLENEWLRIVVIPELGGKVASMYKKDKQFELLFQHKENTYRKPGRYAAFVEYDAAGFDDAFPSIDSGRVLVGNRELEYPDHGEIWTAEFSYSIESGDRVRLTFQSPVFPYRYQKQLVLQEKTLLVRYAITNTGDAAFPCIWAMHCLLRCEEDMEIEFPPGTQKVLNVQDSEILGSAGQIHSYPFTQGKDGREYRLDRVLPAVSGSTKKYYCYGPVQEGHCGVYYPTQKVRYRVSFDKEKLPYVGFWVTEGGFRGDYNCALEPANGYYDAIAIAEKNNALYRLAPAETLSFAIAMELD